MEYVAVCWRDFGNPANLGRHVTARDEHEINFSNTLTVRVQVLPYQLYSGVPTWTYSTERVFVPAREVAASRLPRAHKPRA